MSQQIAVRLPERELALLDAAIAEGRFSNRAAAIRAGLHLVLREEREREVEAAYRRGYGEQPQEDWVGDAGLALLTAFAAAEGRDREPL